jgi:hypothetical protein
LQQRHDIKQQQCGLPRAGSLHADGLIAGGSLGGAAASRAA